ncbi:MAG: glycine oxidase ThiO [Pseudomonadota bacterium]|nr:glycine oxidase ThiO [Pseudomonadota bacterium]
MKTLIIGGGVIGLLSALELARAGYQVTVLDKQQHGQAASWAGGGILSPLYPWRYLPAVNQLASYAPFLYHSLAIELMESTGIDIEVSRCGMLILDHEDRRDALSWYQQHPENRAEWQQGQSLQQLNPRLNPSFQQGLWCPDIGHVRNPRLLKALIKHLEKIGVKLIRNTEIIQFESSGEQISAVIDQQQRRWQADQYVICSGAWSGRLSQLLQVELPIRPIKGQMILYKAPARWLPTIIMHQNMYLIPRLDGHILCGSTLEDQGFDLQTDSQAQQTLIQQAESLAPELASMPIKKHWAGLRPAAPHGIPFIGRTPQYDNLWVNAGHFRNGIVLAPASARLLREQMLNQRTTVTATDYQFAERLTGVMGN